MALSLKFIILGGSNGFGKPIRAVLVLPGVIPYFNADEIAKGLPDTDGENKDARASRLLIRAMDEYEAQRKSFAIETTLASRSLAPRVKRLQAAGYQFQLLFFWLNDPELNIQRVAERVRSGGHHIPEDVIRRFSCDDVLTGLVRQAIREAVLGHKRNGNPVAGSVNGQVVIFQPEEIDVTAE